MPVSPEPVAFYIGSFPVAKYGVIIGLSVLLGTFLLSFFAKKFYSDLSEDTVFDFAFWLIIGGIIGARLWYVILASDYYSNHLLEIFALKNGGLTVHGAIFGGFTTAIVYSKIKKLNFFKIADICALSMPLCQALGRWGNYFNSEAFGKPCDLPWKIFIPLANRPEEFQNFQYFHPTFFYEFIANIVIFLILFIASKKLIKSPGKLFFLWLILYSAVRIFIEFIRIDSVTYIFNVPVAVIVSAFVGTIALCGFFVVGNKR